MRIPGILAAAALTAGCSTMSDPHQWLEDVHGEKQQAWVRAQSAVAQKELEAQPGFKALEARLLAAYNSKEKIPYVGQRHGKWYNFWQDDVHVRGLWRRTTPAEYRKKDPEWETVLDIDALAEAEKENWVWKGPTCLPPEETRCLVALSRGGGDAAVIREFDLLQKEFIEGGFSLPEAKSGVEWRDLDTLLVATDFGEGSLTESGYPRIVKEWKRGTPLSAARTIYEGKVDDVFLSPFVSVQPDGVVYEGVHRRLTFFTSETYLLRNSRLVKLELPTDIEVEFFRDQMLLRLRNDWTVNGTTHPAGALLAIQVDAFLAGKRDFEMLFTPAPRKSLVSYNATRNVLVVNELENVATRLYTLRPQENGWRRRALEIPRLGTVSLWGVDSISSDEYFMTVTDFVTPTQLFHGTMGPGKRRLLKEQPEFFDASGLEISQHEAVSKDGTRIPYFQVSRKGIEPDGTAPTLLHGYGGFESSELPYYSATFGVGWLERGGVLVIANIRGGGEFGPAWHQAALKENRQRAYDDFIAVAESLVARKVTSPQHLGVMGGSNGGLLVGVMATQRPDLFGAVVCGNPLLDMKRYTKLLAGASWIGEYGDPDKPEEWAYISKYSPYHNVHDDKEYPRIFFTTSSFDDRVHPAHARKMFAKMREQGHDVLLYENTDGGHSGSANNKQAAYGNALEFTFLWKQLN